MDEAERTTLFLHFGGLLAPSFQRGARGPCMSCSAVPSHPAVLPASPLRAALMAACLPHIPWGQGQQADGEACPLGPGLGHSLSTKEEGHFLSCSFLFLGRSGCCIWSWPWSVMFHVSTWTHLSHGAQRPSPNGCLNPSIIPNSDSRGMVDPTQWISSL